MNFLNKILDNGKKDGGNKLGGGSGGGRNGNSNNSKNNNNNPLLNFAQQQRRTNNFGGQGKSLGGNAPGKVIPVELSEPGPLGLRIEKRPNSEGTAIISQVVEGGQAEKAGLQRGDVLCFGGSNGQEEIMYDHFIELAASPQRPLCFEVRRIPSKKAAAGAAGAAGNGSQSAEAYARKQAVIAAAEAREKASQNKSKPIKRYASQQPQPQQQQQDEDWDPEPKSEASRRAREAAKQSEAATAASLGYNPYETNRVTAGQARNATVASTHGVMGGGGGSDNKSSSTGAATNQSSSARQSGSSSGAVRAVQPPRSPTEAATDDDDEVAQLSPEFMSAYETMVTMNDHEKVVSSFGILRKLLVNATTKGQQGDSAGDDSAKFRRVRLANAKIRAAIVDLDGALDIMLSAGFHLEEDNDESVLVFPYGNKGPAWLPTALKHMEDYEKS